MSQETIVDFLDEVFDGLKVDAIRDDAGQRTVFHIEVDVGIEMLLAISDSCFSSQSIADIETAIQTQAKSLLEGNHDTLVTMSDDLQCSV